MRKEELSNILLTKENLYKLILMIFGLTLFPIVVYLFQKAFLHREDTVLTFYSDFYRSLLHFDREGFFAWGVACTPYFVYEIFLVIRSFGGREREKEKEIEGPQVPK
jgi:hypothetical protein